MNRIQSVQYSALRFFNLRGFGHVYALKLLPMDAVYKLLANFMVPNVHTFRDHEILLGCSSSVKRFINGGAAKH